MRSAPAKKLRRSHHRIARGIVDGDPKIETRPVPRSFPPRRGWRASSSVGNAVAAADDPHPNIVGDAAIGLGDEITPEEPHQERDFARRPRPVVGGERVEREHADSAIGRGLDDLPHHARAGDVPRGARTAPRIRPPAIPVHDDRDVDSRLRGSRLRRAGARVLHGVAV